MKKYVICKYCKQSEENNPVFIVRDCNEDNELSKSYIHIGCKVKQLREQDNLDKLIATIMRIYNLHVPTDIPSLIYTKINNMRNGTYKDNVKYKQGYSYAVIEHSFIIAESVILKALKEKDFTVRVKDPNNFAKAKIQKQLLYGLAVVYDKLPQAYRDLQRIKAQKKLEAQKKVEPVIEQPVEIDNLSFAPKQTKNKYDWLEDDN